jgi:hypothetical protein
MATGGCWGYARRSGSVGVEVEVEVDYGLRCLMGPSLSWVENCRPIIRNKNGKLLAQNGIPPNRTENCSTIFNPVSHFYCPVSIRLHFHPHLFKNSRLKSGNGSQMGQDFPVSFLGQEETLA